tara:strand:+ start:29664 stop:29879 length:216 start_codon:yes stop_codon:yes gene_type:complete
VQNRNIDIEHRKSIGKEVSISQPFHSIDIIPGSFLNHIVKNPNIEANKKIIIILNNFYPLLIIQLIILFID